MEHIGTALKTEQEENRLRQKPSPVTVITTEAEKTLGTIIFRTRLAKGWNGYDEVTQKMAVQTWYEILQTERVPVRHYDELYRKACNHQAFVLQQGKEPPEMSAQLMLSQWIGPNGLQKEIEQRRISEGRTLNQYAESQCPKCFGSKMEAVEGKGARPCPNCNPVGFERWQERNV